MKKLRIFIASPGDVSEERDIVSLVTEELSRTLGDILNVQLETVRWETHAWPDIGEDAQDIINKEIGDYDVLVGIMWERFGTPTNRSSSGTGEEFERAYQYFTTYQRPKIMFYFNKTLFYSNDLKEISQFRKVIQFKKKLAKLGTLYWEYENPLEFERRFREHLTRQIHHLTQKPKKEPKAVRPPKIFISYVREDLRDVEHLYNSLKAAGFDPWLDVKDISPGQQWLQNLGNAIRTSDYFLACISEKSVRTKGVIQKELRWALDAIHKHSELSTCIIPVRLAPVQPPESLMKFQWIDIFDSKDVNRLIATIRLLWNQHKKDS